MTVRYLGMNSQTGLSISEVEHIRQSVRDILVTPVGSRVMRREYGSLVPALIDKPDNLATQTRFFAAAASAPLPRAGTPAARRRTVAAR